MPFLSTPQDVWYVVASVCLIAITFFLCWAFLALIKLLRQTDEMMSETRERMEVVEEGVASVVDKLSSAVGYMGLLAEGGKQVYSFLARKGIGKNKKKRSNDDEE